MAEDYARPAAEAAILRLGGAARAALLRSARKSKSNGDGDSESRSRARRSATSLLAHVGISPGQISAVKQLAKDDDCEVALHPSLALMKKARVGDKEEIIRRLISLVPRVHWILHEEIEACLLDHLDVARELLFELTTRDPPAPDDHSPRAQIARVVTRVLRRATGAQAEPQAC